MATPSVEWTLGGRPGGKGGKPVPYQQAKIGLALFDVESDPGETTNVAGQHPDVVAKIKQLADRIRKDLGDSATGQKGAGVRQPGRLEPGVCYRLWTEEAQRGLLPFTPPEILDADLANIVQLRRDADLFHRLRR